jgi:phosphoribosyl 1,2-cyclic phosphate phosphodiesterase
MDVIFLGTGTSQGVPVIAHRAAEPDLSDPRNWRTRTSIHVVMNGHHIQVDAAPELRMQCLTHRIEQVDTFILTHGHADHILGMDDLRRFIDLRNGEALPVYSSAEGLDRVRAIFPYAICDRPAVSGYPAFSLRPMPDCLDLPGVGRIRSVALPHGPLTVLGLVFEEAGSGARFAYYTDCKEVPPAAHALACGCDLLVLDALRPAPHPGHLSTSEAIAAAQSISARTTRFIHMTYQIDHARDNPTLPPGMEFSYDGLRLRLPEAGR